jgi:hypothetical protein
MDSFITRDSCNNTPPFTFLYFLPRLQKHTCSLTTTMTHFKIFFLLAGKEEEDYQGDGH